MTNISFALALSFGWLCLIVLAYYGAQNRGGMPRTVRTVLFAAAVARLAPLLVLPVGAGYDIESFRRVGQTLIEGGEVYTSTLVAGRHPYLPLQLYVIGGLMQLAEWTGAPFVILIKLPNVLADIAIVTLIYRALVRVGHSPAQSADRAMLYALNPIPILISAYHGQFDALTLLLLLLAWYTWQIQNRPVLSALCLGLAVLDKTWPLLFLPIILLRLPTFSSRLVYLGTAISVVVAGIAIYTLIWQADVQAVLRRPLSHFGVPGWWGFGAVLELVRTVTGNGAQALTSIAPLSRYLVLIAAGLIIVFTRHDSALQAMTTCVLVIYVITFGFGLQYLVWVVPFAAYGGSRRWLNLFTPGALLYLVVNYYGLHMYPLIPQIFEPAVGEIILRAISIPAWLIAAAWLLAGLRRRPAVGSAALAPS